MRRRVAVTIVVALVLLSVAGLAYAAFSGTTANDGNSLTAAAAFPGYRDEVMADNPGAYWRLGETSGTTADDQTANDNDGTYAGGPTLGQTGGLLDDGDKAVSFDGTNDRVSVPDNASLDLGDGPLSIEAWIKRSATSQDDAIVDKGGNAYRLYLRATDNKLVLRKNGVGDIVASTRAITDTTSWHHVVGTKNGATVKLYIDGIDVTATVTNQTMANNANSLTIGDNGGGSQYFNGLIDEVDLYGTVLSSARVRAHYWGGRPYHGEVLTDNPGAYWRLGEPVVAATAFDTKGTNHGTFRYGVTLGQADALLTTSNSAGRFDGVDDWVSVPDSSSLDVGDAMSVEAWFKRSSTGTADTILEKGSGAYKLALTTANRVRFRRSAVADIVDSTITITDTNTWHHVVATKNGATVKLYIDGVDRTGTVTNSTLANSSDPVTIGNNSTTEYFDGYLDDVAVYNTALSAARVKAHYRAGQPYAGEVVDDSPVSYWRLGETSGTTAVDRMATSNGTYTNGPTLGQSGAPTGDPDTAVSFDGTNDYVSVPDSASLDRGNGPLSIEAWVKRSVAGANHTIVDKGTNAYKLFIGSDNLLTLRKAGSNNIVKSTTTITDTNWHHVVVTKTGATSKVYIDGADVTGTVTDQTLANTASPLGIGSISGGTTEWFNGSLDEVAVYGVVLTADQVREHYYRAP